jgi:hypothetical protein
LAAIVYMFKPKGLSVDACFMQPIPGSYLVELQPAICEMIKKSSQTNVDQISCFISDKRILQTNGSFRESNPRSFDLRASALMTN